MACQADWEKATGVGWGGWESAGAASEKPGGGARGGARGAAEACSLHLRTGGERKERTISVASLPPHARARRGWGAGGKVVDLPAP